MELDVFAYSNAGEAFVVEIRNRPGEDGLQDLLQILQDFRAFLPEHRDKKLYGILAAVDISAQLRDMALGEGIYLAKIHEDVFEIQVPEDFQPRAF